MRPASAILPLLILAGCHAIAGLDQDYKPPQAAGPGGAGGTGGAGGAGGAACDLAKPPPPPAGPTGGDIEIVVALRNPDLGEAAQGLQYGFDLDDLCTDCASNLPRSCEPPIPGKFICDSATGIDNGGETTFAQLAVALGAPTGAVTQLLNQGVNAGSWNLLLRVNGYNGQPDDADVEVAAFASTGSPATPQWDGQDVWNVDDTSLGASGALSDPLFVTASAYVSGGKLVARLDRVPLRIRAQLLATYRLDVELTSVILSADVVQDGGTYELQLGTLAGVWLLPDIFAGLSGFREGMQPICTDDMSYLAVKDAVCSGVDTLSTGVPGGTCDGISFGMFFNAQPIVLGNPEPPPPPSAGCSGPTDPISDTCD